MRAARLLGPTGTGIRRVLMGGDEQDVRVVPEQVLGAVAVVHVPVDDEHPLTAVGERSGGDRDVVEQAEALTPCRHRVVTGWAHDDERGVGVAVGERLDRVQATPRGARRRRERSRGDDGVGVEQPATIRARTRRARRRTARRALG